jgi:para-aminobenzoate synthetase / 4-amino-4-deoxychorismate lyase
MSQTYWWQQMNVVAKSEQLPLELSSPETSLLETIAVRAGQPVWLERHLARLGKAASDLWSSELKPAELLPRFTEVWREQEGRLQCLLFADGSSAWIFKAEEFSCRPMRVMLLEVAQPLGCYKKGNRVRHSELLEQAWRQDADEALLMSGGDVLEGTFTNFLLHDHSGWWTPPLDGRILPGIMRELLLLQLRHVEETVQENEVTVARLQQCDRLLLCNSLRGVIPVKELLLPGGETVCFP